jgi:hypothetical protein
MNPGSQNERNTAQQFAKLVKDHFGEDFANYPVETKGFGLEMYFNNYALVQRVGNFLVRFTCDREELYLEIAERSAPEMYREPRKPNLWFDASVLSAYLEKATGFAWFYDYAAIPLDAPNRAENQLAVIARKMRSCWPDVQDLFSDAKYPQEQERLMEFRENQARASWQALGWQDKPPEEKPGKEKRPFWSANKPRQDGLQVGGAVVLGHFPEFMDKARETDAKFLGIAPQVWVTLQRDELRWAVTKQFLDSAWKARSTFVLATEMRSPTSYFARELQYLVSLGKAV